MTTPPLAGRGTSWVTGAGHRLFRSLQSHRGSPCQKPSRSKAAPRKRDTPLKQRLGLIADVLFLCRGHLLLPLSVAGIT